jgi:hypothetical protein
MGDSFTQRGEERAENQAACSGQRPREFSWIGRVANQSVRVWKGSLGSKPWRSAYLRNEAKFVVALDVGGTATLGGASTAPLPRLCGKDRQCANLMSRHANCP